MATLETEVLVVGSGIGGCTAAIELARRGYDVVVATSSREPEESSTKYAQGGIVAEGLDDTPELLEEDVIRAGDGFCLPEAVHILATEGPALVQEFLIEELGVKFTRTAEGELDLTKEAAHSTRRILHADDATGRAIEIALLNGLKRHENIHLMTAHTAVDLLTTTHHSTDPMAVYGDDLSAGAYVLEQSTGEVHTVLANRTVVATGGAGRIYLHTTNPPVARGDGIAMAYRAGARIVNAEYVQFHPTTFYHRLTERFLISESVRGEGGRLMTRDGRLFMADYDAKLKDLAPRDVVARAIHEEMVRLGDDFVLLDLASFADEGLDIAGRFPNIRQSLLPFGVDIVKDPIPVVPSAHYFCGGIRTDLFGRTDIAGCYAVGEVACTGLHGANRLASTSLLEGLVWGARAARHIAETYDEATRLHFKNIPPWRYTGVEDVDPALIQQDWLDIRATMWNYAGIVRTARRLERALADLGYLHHRIEQFYRAANLNDDLVGLRNGIMVALIVVQAALRNKASRGCHYRKD